MQTSEQTSQLKIAIVGKGAIGGLIASKCQSQKIPYQLLLRQTSSNKIEVEQSLPFILKIEDILGNTHTLATKVAEIGQDNNFDLVILPIKAYQISDALHSLKSTLLPNQVIVLLHNGMGTIEEVKQHFPNNPCIAGTTSYGAYKCNANYVKETGLGETHLGWVTPLRSAQSAKIKRVLASLLPPTIWHSDISLALWRKLTINGVINPLTAIHNIKNGQLAEEKYTEQISRLCGEISCIMNHLGYTDSTADLRDLVMSVIHKTANNFSSMHQDIQHNRPTEIDYINGYISKAAASLSLPATENSKLCVQIKRLETSS
ncbi:2-dehydropantoate 2-reductase [Paraglaciecola aquimarina]|uniref:2-dehydropantoate 2-reductase n=1 Tax=Paraglaciecola aquimarina TaxID=1235557 RepID=A0ABU3T0B4_9ALTE|nr:2-dehydropantoate 2-reductase [Paraglaciecola aquimarina]MDU0355617.1 2-dehydropantoate 2-reductase [Paraglaciecola aquimarina]